MMNQWREPTKTSFSVRDFDKNELDGFIETLRELGIEASVAYGRPQAKGSAPKTATVTVTYPHRVDARRSRTRHAGRRRARISYDAVIKFGTVRAFLEWYDSGHTAEEGMAELGMARSTFFRAVKRMREKLEAHDQLNAARARSGDYPQLAELKLSDFS